MAVEFPQRHIGALQELAARLLDSRKTRTDLAVLARDLLLGFYDICVHSGLDRVLGELDAAFGPLDVSDRAGLADQATLLQAVVARLDTINLHGGGPTNIKPRQIGEGVVAR